MLLLLLLTVASLASATTTAQGWSNGNVPGFARSAIFAPGFKNTLAKGAAASWNNQRLCSLRQGVDLYSSGPRAAYRTYGEQVYFWNLYKSGRGNLAAFPGTSNHGSGTALDLAQTRMRAWIDSHGGLGWRKIEAFSEWWHVNYTTPQPYPNPGPLASTPTLRVGSRGACQAPFVRELESRLRFSHPDGTFQASTAGAVKRFEKRHHWKHPDGVATASTWNKLRGTTRGTVTLALTTPRMRGPDVKVVQGLLNARFIELRYKSRVTVDGVYGPQTALRVKLFQRAVHITADGRVGPTTLRKLRTSARAPTLPQPTTTPPKPSTPIQPRVAFTQRSPNHGTRWTGIGAIVVHTTEGFDRDEAPSHVNGLHDLGSFFANPSSQVASHVANDRNGASARFVADNLRAWHVGRHNTYSLGIEQLGFARFTRAQWLHRKAQLDSTAAWIAYWSVKYKIPIRRCTTAANGDLKTHGVCSHGQLDPRNRSDPGAGYPFDYVIARARSLAGSGV